LDAKHKSPRRFKAGARLNFRIPDFPRGALVASVLTATGIFFAVPNVPYAWAWAVIIVFGIAVWALNVGGLKATDSQITAIATLLLAVVTGCVALIAYWQWDALHNTDTTLHDTFVAANRAWITPVFLTVHNEVGPEKDVPIEVHYVNAGKGPAIQMNSTYESATLSIGSQADYVPISGGPNNTCASLHIDPDGIAVFPDQQRDTRINISYPRAYIANAVASKDIALLLRGCFVYSTMNEIHYTWFCYVVYSNGRFASASATTQCKDGHGAR
jgi:hypothetical protein